MIIVDTNVLSELVKAPHAEPRVLTWARSLREQPVTTALSRAELLAGAALLPAGRHRDALVEGIARVLSDVHVSLPFSSDCAAAYAEIRAVRTHQGRPIATMDALIASVAAVHSAAVATRDTTGFSGLGLTVVDPWVQL